jgi:hypothetical protein
MTLDELLLEWSYRSEKGYPNMDNPSDIHILKQLLEKLKLPSNEIINNLKEGTKASNTRNAIAKIVDSSEGKEAGLTIMANTYRIGNKKKIDKDQFMEILNSLFNNPQITIHEPKSGPNKSSKYNMFEFETEEGQVQIILAGGANEGEVYEQDLLAKIQGSVGFPIDEIEFPDIQKLFNTIGIDPEDITPDDTEFMGAADTKRQLSFEGPTDLGAKVADLVIHAEQDIYLSIKNKKGSGIYNGGNVPFITLNEEGIAVFDKSKYDEKPLFREIFEACGIDPQRMADGLTAYITQEGEASEWESSTDVDLTKVKNLLASSFGYGYWYVREKTKGEIFVHYIDGEQGAYDMVGELNADAVKIKYPGTNTKALDVVIDTNSPILSKEDDKTPLRYQIVVRNASGKTLPARLNIRTNK